MKFEWDSEKEKVNINKHGITFEQASYVFADPFALNKYDDNIEYVRIISARKATNNEQQSYQRRCPK